jgi:hypothetical protein
MTKPYDPFGHKVQITPEHYRVHEGESFVTGYFWSESASSGNIADNATVCLLVQPGAGMHTIANVMAGGEAEVYFSSGTTTSSSTAATSVTPINKNAYSNKTSACTVSWGTTAIVTDYGTDYPGALIAGGSGGNAVGGSYGGYERETVLKADVNYLIRVTNRSGGVAPVSINIEYYEPGASS